MAAKTIQPVTLFTPSKKTPEDEPLAEELRDSPWLSPPQKMAKQETYRPGLEVEWAKLAPYFKAPSRPTVSEKIRKFGGRESVELYTHGDVWEWNLLCKIRMDSTKKWVGKNVEEIYANLPPDCSASNKEVKSAYNRIRGFIGRLDHANWANGQLLSALPHGSCKKYRDHTSELARLAIHFGVALTRVTDDVYNSPFHHKAAAILRILEDGEDGRKDEGIAVKVLREHGMPQYPSFKVPHGKDDADSEEEDVLDRDEVKQWRMAVFDRFIDEDSDEEEEEYSQNAMAAAVSIMDSAEKK